MPSSHARSVAKVKLPPGGRRGAAISPLDAAAARRPGAYGATSLAWRVTNRHHTAPQVLVGGAFGAATALAFRRRSLLRRGGAARADGLAWVLGIYGAGAVGLGPSRSQGIERALKKRRHYVGGRVGGANVGHL